MVSDSDQIKCFMWSLVVRFEVPFCHSHFGASMQLDYDFLPSAIPVPFPTPTVDEHHEVIGLTSAELSD